MAFLKELFDKFERNNKGIKIDVEYLNNLRFVDDIVLLCESRKLKNTNQRTTECESNRFKDE